MTPSVSRDGDTTNHGGTISSVITSTRVNNRLVLTIDAIHHCPLHGDNPVVTGSSIYRVESKPVARIGDSTACGAVITTGSSDTFSE